MLLYARDIARGRNGCDVPLMVGRGSCYPLVVMASKYIEIGPMAHFQLGFIVVFGGCG